MAEPIGPGDWVECVEASPCWFYGPTGLTRGALYEVCHVGPGECESGFGVWLVGFRSNGPRGGYGIHRFRKVYRPNADLIQSLLRPVPAEPETVGA